MKISAKTIITVSALGMLNAIYLSYLYLQNKWGEAEMGFCDINSSLFKRGDESLLPIFGGASLHHCTVRLPDPDRAGLDDPETAQDQEPVLRHQPALSYVLDVEPRVHLQ